jgi:apolipoprotein N-acyltransferase
MAEARSTTALRAAGPLAPLQRTALWVTGLAGWRRYGLAFLLGALAAAAMAPVHSVPVLIVSFSALVWLIDGVARPREAFALGWSFGFGFFTAGLYWIAAALFVDIARFWWMVPFSVLGFPAFLGLITGACLLLAFIAIRRFHLRGSARILAVALAWSLGEYLRGHILTGFPWNLIGYAWADVSLSGTTSFPGSLAMLQSCAYIGIYVLSLVTIVAAALPARLGDLGRGRFWAPLAALLLVLLPMGAGALRLAEGSHDMVPGVRLRLVQPAIPETMKMDRDWLQRSFQRLLSLSAAPGAAPATILIWPESAAPPLLERYPEARQAMAGVTPRGGLLLTGAERAEPLQGWPPRDAWNSLVALDDRGDIIATYDKAHLVPFGEYVPLRHLLPIDKIVPSALDFSTGPGPRTLTVPGAPAFGPLICYEAIFPGAAIEPQHRPDWLLNITNDAWYGVSSGPYQHLAIARARAVEEGLPLVRAANNGVSAIIDGYGRILTRLDLDAVGTLDGQLPIALAPTLYEKWRDGMFALIALLLLATVYFCTRITAHLEEVS